jgi:hypothetical protein
MDDIASMDVQPLQESRFYSDSILAFVAARSDHFGMEPPTRHPLQKGATRGPRSS